MLVGIYFKDVVMNLKKGMWGNEKCFVVFIIVCWIEFIGMVIFLFFYGLFLDIVGLIGILSMFVN